MNAVFKAHILVVLQFRPSWSVDHITGKYSLSIQSPTGITTDPPLTSHGINQAHELADHLVKIEPPIDQVYSSPYYRCMQTIQPFVSLQRDLEESRNRLSSSSASESGQKQEPQLTIRAEGGISEWFGTAHFEHPQYAPLSTLVRLFPEIDTNYESAVTRPANGESAAELHLRVARAVETIIERSDREGHRAVLLCSHAATIIALGRVLTGRVPDDLETDDFRTFTCGLSIYRRRGRGEGTLSSTIISTGAAAATGRDGAIVVDGAQDSSSFTISGTDPAVNVDHNARSRGGADPEADWRDRLSLRGGWVCEANSDCSFLSCGAERGW